VLHLACYISNGILALLLVILSLRHEKLVKELINKILESKGMEGIPEEHPIADILGKLHKEATEPQTPEQKRLMKTAQERIHFTIPNMGPMKMKNPEGY